ncbi:excinuclease ABC subunit C [Megasphaera cerevisiae DSM 20462]|jgi:excinuclease ABC subunit C|uniref:UvrABC system protein C n=1 Tax=Megasphaera cerevisiae DSM 20462 TaxID=1122219 RepID=A0A0J6WWY5_9FIRM|nr:excinuclease ABC subunit UvrC [Megasphaera cerevisiae]KMO87124.1 excinuclease ABC subunit C [Megasphaera cerevisiae DSM 20462]MCI1751175.1 excinuclease ABC subunit UvrC [Megasphaera cerevisiae]SJZ45987.1 Excinuclease ABC subunit C [Megasphaera cerevisiae DSM 20462]
MAVSEAVLEKIHNLTTQPGVYLWKDVTGRIIYVGKAVNLRNRVKSYVRRDVNRSPKVAAMMSHAVDLETMVVTNEMEALILENTLIKKHHPRYNIMLRDDKTYPYIKVTLQEDYPRIYMTRRVLRDGARYFGPFADAGAVHRVLKLLQRAFHIRSCRTMRTDRPCLQYHLGHCDAPCVHYITRAAYGELVQQAVNVLDGRDTGVLRELQSNMEEAAEQMEFEKAAMYRDQIQSIHVIQKQQTIVTQGGGDMDVLGFSRDAGQTCVQIYLIRRGKLMGRETFSLDNSADETAAALTDAVLDQYYTGDVFVPREIVAAAVDDVEGHERRLSAKKGQHVSLVVPQRGLKKKLLDMAEDNARVLLEQRRLQWQHDKDKTSGAVEALARILDLPHLPERMECFDISHTQGIETVASMVVFEGGRPAKKEYRRFKLKTVQGKPDDFKSMAEIMGRRYRESEWPEPDLIIIDGGKGQLHAALPVIRAAGCEAPVVSLAKRIEEVFVEGRSDSIILDHHTPELQLLQAIRDEAHRFAITYHRSLRGKRSLVSILDHVEGIGPKRRKALWQSFKTLEDMKGATVEELAAVPGMSRQAAENVYYFFRLGTDEKRKMI